jgi:hypothetical protein
VTKDDLVEVGFDNSGGGGLCRFFYEDFVIDALECIRPVGAWRIEIRAGSDAQRIEGEVHTREEIEMLLAILDRRSRRNAVSKRS